MADRINPVVLVTGSSRGIGRGVALTLAEEGYSVAINYAGNEEAARETQRLCTDAASAAGQNAAGFEIFKADVGKKPDRDALVENVFSSMGRVDALVNNAGIGPRERLDITEATEESFEEVMRVNLQGPYFLSQAIVRRWLEGQKSGHLTSAIPSGFKLIFVSSISAYTASVNRGEYCVSKAGMSMASKLWATRLADENIQVYEVRPGIMETDLTSKVKGKYDKLIGEGLVPQKRWGQPSDMGLTIRAIVRGDLPFSTGSVIDVDGGFNMMRL